MRPAFPALLLSAFSLLGCVRAEDFPCERDNQCVSTSIVGVCVPETNFCAFPNASCDSYARYGLAVGEGKEGTCVSCSELPETCDASQPDCAPMGCQICLACASSGSCQPEADDCLGDSSCENDLADLLNRTTARDRLRSTVTGEALQACLEQECSPSCLDD